MSWFICGANVLELLRFVYIYFFFFWHFMVGSSKNQCYQGEQIRYVTRNAPCICKLLCTRLSNNGIFTNKIRVQAAISEGNKRYHGTNRCHLVVEALLTLFRLINSFRCLKLMSEACPVWHVLYHIWFGLMMQSEIWIIQGALILNYQGPGCVSQVRRSLVWTCSTTLSS
jgi:hypothetical protein